MKTQSDLSLSRLADELRIDILEMLTHAKSGHPGGSLSCIDLMVTLWFRVMKGVKNPSEATQEEFHRDRFVLSKGHGVPALYAILAKKGWIDRSEFSGLRQYDSRLQGHPDRVRLPIVEASTGSLGQGLSIAQGLAMGMKMDGSRGRVFCVLGDGEIQEGQVWESVLSAPKFKLSNLVAIVDANNGQIDGPVSEVMPLEPLPEKWRSFGWDVHECSGHDFEKLLSTFLEIERRAQSGSTQPSCLIARTVKGKGVSFMENQISWHGVAPKPSELETARREILGRLS
jgi:transketolase